MTALARIGIEDAKQAAALVAKYLQTPSNQATVSTGKAVTREEKLLRQRLCMRRYRAQLAGESTEHLPPRKRNRIAKPQAAA